MTAPGSRLVRSLCLLAGWLAAGGALGDESCRVAFDLGSSGIRVGGSTSDASARADIDYLSPAVAGRGLQEVLAPTMAILRDLPGRLGFPAECARVGGGFSAWRLALERDPRELAGALARLRNASGVAVLVIPQEREGSYGYVGARRLLGERLNTSHVLDIGGGSLQVAGERTAYGAALGQKLWHRELCRELGRPAAPTCALQPLAASDLAAARTLAGRRLAGAALPDLNSLTAISRPVTRGVQPAVQRLAGAPATTMDRAALATAIERLSALAPAQAAALLDTSPDHAAYLLSDMLLVEGLMRVGGVAELKVAEVDLTNVPGLLADDHAFAWSSSYDCYLERLRSQGLAAYASDPATCFKR